MSYADLVFVNNCKKIIETGIDDNNMEVRPKWSDGTPAHTKKILYVCDQYQLAKDSIPVMTLRKTGFKNAIDEILWIYQRKSNRLEDLNSHIWDSWDVGDGTIGKAYGYQVGLQSAHHKYTKGECLEGIDHFVSINDVVYMSQIDAVIWDLKNNSGSRSIMINMYNHQDLMSMGLRPCAFMMSFNVSRVRDQLVLNGCLVQRSQDMLTANNWNVVQYSVLLQMLAQVTGMIPGVLSHVVMDMHIYDRHIPIVQQMIDQYMEAYTSAKLEVPFNIDHQTVNQYEINPYYTKHTFEVPFKNPKFWINPDIKNFYDFTIDDFKLDDYQYLPFNHKIEVAV